MFYSENYAYDYFVKYRKIAFKFFIMVIWFSVQIVAFLYRETSCTIQILRSFRSQILATRVKLRVFGVSSKWPSIIDHPESWR